MNRLLITGASGFVGSHLVPFLQNHDYEVLSCSRSLQGPQVFPTPEELHSKAWTPLLQGVYGVIHLAAQTQLKDDSTQAAEELHNTNVHMTRSLIRAAVQQKVQRVILISSIKVHGEGSHKLLTSSSPVSPSDSYGMSKWQAEQSLWELTQGSSTEGVILRLPLVYGPGVKGNFLSLLQWVHRGIPLPGEAEQSKRSLLGIGNLCSAIALSLNHPKASGQTFLVSDEESISTPELIRKLGELMKHQAKIWPIPQKALSLTAKVLGKEDLLRKFLSSSQIDRKEIQERLGWVPPQKLEEGLQSTINWFLQSQEKAMSLS